MIIIIIEKEVINIIQKQIAYWKNLSSVELWVSIIYVGAVWAKILNWLGGV